MIRILNGKVRETCAMLLHQCRAAEPTTPTVSHQLFDHLLPDRAVLATS